MDKEYQKNRFTELRFEYYVTGRLIWFSDTMSIGAMMLGYSIELSLKYLLIDSDCLSNALRNSHNCLKLCEACEEAELFHKNRFSHDLLQYVTDMFHQRYPSQSIVTSRNAMQRGHSIGMSLDMIMVYDDLIITLDEIIAERISDGSTSIAFRGAEYINRKQGKAFFHANVAAAKNVDAYREHVEKKCRDCHDEMAEKGLTPETIKYNLNNWKQRVQVWKNAPKSIWCYEPLASLHNPNPAECKNDNYARDFKYPGKYESLGKKGSIIARSTFNSLLK